MIPFKIIKSNRKSIAIEVTLGGEVLIRTPFGVSDLVAEKFALSHEEWITKTLKKQEHRRQQKPSPTPEKEKELKQKAREVLPQKVEHFAKLMNVKPTGIKITSAKTRFGSCNGKNSLCFSYLLMQYPEECIDYVVVHELAHIRHHNHSPLFWAEVEKYIPDYKQRRKLMK